MERRLVWSQGLPSATASSSGGALAALRSRGLLAAMETAERQGTAAVTYEGIMVDIAMVKTAEQVLARAIGATT